MFARWFAIRFAESAAAPHPGRPADPIVTIEAWKRSQKLPLSTGDGLESFPCGKGAGEGEVLVVASRPCTVLA